MLSLLIKLSEDRSSPLDKLASSNNQAYYINLSYPVCPLQTLHTTSSGLAVQPHLLSNYHRILPSFRILHAPIIVVSMAFALFLFICISLSIESPKSLAMPPLLRRRGICFEDRRWCQDIMERIPRTSGHPIRLAPSH